MEEPHQVNNKYWDDTVERKHIQSPLHYLDCTIQKQQIRATNMVTPLVPESIEWFIEERAFLRSYDMAPPSPFPLLP